MNLDYVVDVEIDGIHTYDHPDYVDAFVGDAAYPRFHWILGYLFNLIPSQRRTVNEYGLTTIHPRFFKLRRFLGPLVYRKCTEQELDEINENRDFVYAQVERHLY